MTWTTTSGPQAPARHLPRIRETKWTKSHSISSSTDPRRQYFVVDIAAQANADNAINSLYIVASTFVGTAGRNAVRMKRNKKLPPKKGPLSSLPPFSAARRRGYPFRAGEKKWQSLEKKAWFSNITTHAWSETENQSTHPPLDTETVEIYVARHGRCSSYGTEQIKS